MKLRGAMRVYVDGPDVLRVAGDAEGSGRCHHLNMRDGFLVWVPMPQGAIVEPITLSEFLDWIEAGGLSA